MPKVLNRRTDTIPSEAVYVGRPSKWGNPYKVGASKFILGIPRGVSESGRLTRKEAIERYEWRLRATEIGATLMEQIDELRGKDLVCWCAPLPCHADVLLELANK